MYPNQDRLWILVQMVGWWERLFLIVSFNYVLYFWTPHGLKGYWGPKFDPFQAFCKKRGWNVLSVKIRRPPRIFDHFYFRGCQGVEIFLLDPQKILYRAFGMYKPYHRRGIQGEAHKPKEENFFLILGPHLHDFWLHNLIWANIALSIIILSLICLVCCQTIVES